MALRFLGADRKEGFLEYLKCRLARADDQAVVSNSYMIYVVFLHKLHNKLR